MYKTLKDILESVIDPEYKGKSIEYWRAKHRPGACCAFPLVPKYKSPNCMCECHDIIYIRKHELS